MDSFCRHPISLRQNAPLKLINPQALFAFVLASSIELAIAVTPSTRPPEVTNSFPLQSVPA